MNARKAIAHLGDLTGAGPIARAALDAEISAVARLERLARKCGASETSIRKAKSAKATLEKVQSLAALLFPIVPSPVLLRAIAGKPKSAEPASPRRKRSGGRDSASRG